MVIAFAGLIISFDFITALSALLSSRSSGQSPQNARMPNEGGAFLVAIGDKY